MPETLYAILRGGDILTIDGVTALALDSTKTIKPGDFYRNDFVSQTVNTGLILTNPGGDLPANPAIPLRTESWLCSFWKFARGTVLPTLYLRWSEVEAICNLYPDMPASGAEIYLLLRSGRVAVYSGLADTASCITINTSLIIYPGDFYRNDYLEQTVSSSLVVTNELGDSQSGAALNPETWDASHYQFLRTGLLTLYAPWSNVRGGPATSFPNS